MTGKIKDIERLRAIAVLMVIWCHIPYFRSYVKPIFLQTWTGVDLFFVISGCVVGLSLLNTFRSLSEETSLIHRLQESSSKLKTFFFKRFTRILPMAILWAIIPMTLALTFNSSGTFLTRTFLEAYNQLMAIVSLQFNYAYIFNILPKDMGYYWSLTVEEHFYILLPLMFIFVRKDSNKILISLGIIALITFIIRPFLFPSHTGLDEESTLFWYRFASHNRFDSLLLGLIIGILTYHRSADKTSSGPFEKWVLHIFLLLLALMPGLYLIRPLYSLQITIINFLAFVVVYFSSYNRDMVLPFGKLGVWLEVIGSRSFALYLIHMPSSKIVDECTYRAGIESPAIKIILFIIVCTILTEISYRFVEKPFIKIGHSFKDKESI